MKYQWIKEQTCESLGQELGCAVKSITVDLFPEGELYPQEGIEIELENETPEILAKLDLKLLGLRRENGRDLADVVTDNIVLEYPNPHKEAYKLSQLYGLTHEQLDTLVDGLSTMADYKEAFRKALHVILWLVKQTKLDE